MGFVLCFVCSAVWSLHPFDWDNQNDVHQQSTRDQRSRRAPPHTRADTIAPAADLDGAEASMPAQHTRVRTHDSRP